MEEQKYACCYNTDHQLVNVPAREAKINRMACPCPPPVDISEEYVNMLVWNKLAVSGRTETTGDVFFKTCHSSMKAKQEEEAKQEATREEVFENMRSTLDEMKALCLSCTCSTHPTCTMHHTKDEGINAKLALIEKIDTLRAKIPGLLPEDKQKNKKKKR